MMTLKEIAEAGAVPESTLRLYREEFEEFLPATGEGRRRRYGEESARTLARIAAWKKEGRPSAEIRDQLTRENPPAQKARRRTGEERLDEITALVRAQASETALLRAEVGALRQALRELVTAMGREAHAPPPAREDVEG